MAEKEKGKEGKGIVNFYATLEVDDEADDDVIKKSYRKLVLRWHPDKNPADRNKAEEMIRLINSAYSVLSNPTKREKYDLQRCSVNRKQRGMTPAKPKVSPKMSVPKEFMLQPMGHPEKFLRHDGKKTTVVGRQDIQAKFKEFFETSKFSLWWVPEVNNMCRIRALGSKARNDKRGVSAGLAGGLNLSFRVGADAESEVILTEAEKGKRTENVDFMAKESPEYEGAFRFETACRRGHYLAFLPPCELRVVPLLNEELGRILDFMPLEFSASLKYKDLEEVLRPIAEPKRGTWMPLSALREAPEVANYFKKVMKQDTVWDAEDFAAYFEGHFVDWDYKATTAEVRLRPVEERLGQLLRSSRSTEDVALAVLSAGEELSKLPLSGVLRAIQVMAAAKASAEKKAAKDPPASKQAKKDEGMRLESGEVERMKLLRALPDALSAAVKAIAEETEVPIGHVTVKEIVEAAERLPALVCENPTPDILEHRKEAVKSLVECAVARLEKNKSLTGTPAACSAEELLRLLRLHGAAAHDPALSQLCGHALEKADRSTILQVVHRACTLGCESVAQAAAAVALQGLNKDAPDDMAAAVALLARAGSPVQPLALALLERGPSASAKSLAPAVVVLIEKGAASVVMVPVMECLVAKAPFSDVASDDLLGLALAAAKSPEPFSMAFEPVLGAAADTKLEKWEAADVVRLLLAAVKGKGALTTDTQASLLSAASDVLAPQMGELAAVDLVKLLLAVSGFGASALLESTAKEAVIRLADLSLTHLLLVTQGLAQGLDPTHTCLQQALEFWTSKLKAMAAAQLAAGGPKGVDASRQLTVEQIVKLVVALAPTLQTNVAEARAGRMKLVERVCSQLVARALELSEESRAVLRGHLADGGALVESSKRSELLAALAKRPDKKRLRSPSPGALHQGHLKIYKVGAKKKRKR